MPRRDIGRKHDSGVDWSDPAAVAAWYRGYRAEHSTSKGIKPESGKHKEVRVNGILYSTLADAAQALGITKQRMSQIVKRDGYDIER